MLAVACAAAAALGAIESRSPALVTISGGLALAGVLALAGAIVLARPGWIGPSLASLATLTVAHLVLLDPPAPASAGLAGIALLAAGELAQWSIDARYRGRYDLRVHLGRAGAIGGLVLLGIGAVTVAGIAAAMPVSGGVELMAVATAAAVALFGLTAFVGARAR